MNLFSLRVTHTANLVMTGIMTAAVGAFVIAAMRALHAGVGAGVWFSMKPFYNPATFSLSRVMGAASIAAFSYLGFDGVSTLAEDSRTSRGQSPWLCARG